MLNTHAYAGFFLYIYKHPQPLVVSSKRPNGERSSRGHPTIISFSTSLSLLMESEFFRPRAMEVRIGAFLFSLI
jgi:hypothetical protein